MPRLTATLLMLSICILAASNAHAELGQQLNLGGQTLQLNGAGTRSKAFVQIYECGLYLKTPSRDSAAILDADELMAIRVRITSGFVGRSSLVASLEKGLVQSTGGKTSEIAKETELLKKTLSEEISKNDVYDFVHIPGKGLFIVKNGKVQGTIPGLAFKKALFGIWLSNSPVDQDLRQAMLSGPTRR